MNVDEDVHIIRETRWLVPATPTIKIVCFAVFTSGRIHTSPSLIFEHVAAPTNSVDKKLAHGDSLLAPKSLAAAQREV